MKTLLAAFIVLCGTSICVNADPCSKNVKINGSSTGSNLPDIIVPNDCLTSGFTLKWSANTDWSAVFNSSTPCMPETPNAPPRKHFGSDPDNDGKPHDTCKINSGSITSTAACTIGNNTSSNLLCYQWDYYPNKQKTGEAHDPEVIVDNSSSNITHPTPRAKKRGAPK